jgi:hypothetical protein
MFERNKIDNVPQVTAIPVEVTFTDGTISRGKLLVAIGKAAADVLNGAGAFIELEPYGGERSFVAKSQLASVKLLGVPKAPSLQARVHGDDDFDPHRILGVSVGAGRDEVRQAYIALAKVYHPDRYATAELPPEVQDYLAAMARRINAAHAALDVPLKKQAVRQEPVFSSPGR